MEGAVLRKHHCRHLASTTNVTARSTLGAAACLISFTLDFHSHHQQLHRHHQQLHRHCHHYRSSAYTVVYYFTYNHSFDEHYLYS